MELYVFDYLSHRSRGEGGRASSALRLRQEFACAGSFNGHYGSMSSVLPGSTLKCSIAGENDLRSSSN
jgi:hypothetical protein